MRNVAPPARTDAADTERPSRACEAPIEADAARLPTIDRLSPPVVVPSTALANEAVPRLAPSSTSTTTSPASVTASENTASPPMVVIEEVRVRPSGAESDTAVPLAAEDAIVPTVSEAASLTAIVPVSAVRVPIAFLPVNVQRPPAP